MSALNWKDNASSGGSAARAAREIGGEYRIIRWSGGATWYGEITPTVYGIEYRRGSDWRDIYYPRGRPGTLAEAKQMAEEDYERRRQEAATKANDGACRA
jgi:hypothetical protein